MEGKYTFCGDGWGQKYDRESARGRGKVQRYRSSMFLSHLVRQSPTGPYCITWDDYCTTRFFSKSFALINWISTSAVQFEITNGIHVSCCQSYKMVVIGSSFQVAHKALRTYLGIHTFKRCHVYFVSIVVGFGVSSENVYCLLR